MHDCSEIFDSLGKISIAENGRYDARFLFNGSWRRVRYRTSHRVLVSEIFISRYVCPSTAILEMACAHLSLAIDDRLPFHPTQGTLMCMSILPSAPVSQGSADTGDILWPSLLEKAVMFSPPIF